MNNMEIYTGISRILKERFGIPDELLKGDYIEQSLCGEYFKLNAIELIYFFHEIEKKYNIHISEKDLEKYSFRTIYAIGLIIQSKLENTLA